MVSWADLRGTTGVVVGIYDIHNSGTHNDTQLRVEVSVVFI